jgi:NAD(P)-dependent dehydrogenase (short-subunit alcohol dehydrogenase family)
MPTAVVTGSSTGIGFATALRLAREGCRVYATVRSEASGAALVEAAGALPLSLLVLDVDNDTSVADGIASVITAEGGIDILVNNAGIAIGDAVERTPLETFQAVMNTNMWGTLRCIQAVLPAMREQRHGHIVNVTSIAGRVALPGQGAYSASKWAAEALSETLAAETAPFGIRVAIVEPGVVITPIFDKAAQRPLDTASPYFEWTMRTGRLLLAGLVNPSTSEDTAEVIWRAITTDTPALRYRVGHDAETVAVARYATTDEDWIAGLIVDDDAQWRANMQAWAGTDVPPLG